MAPLPDEIWLQIFDYLEPTDLLHVQCTSKQLLKAARDAQLWRGKCFEKAPSAAQAFTSGDSLSDLLNGLSLTPSASQVANSSGDVPTLSMSRRARAIADWDCTHSDERTDWYTEYIARHAPLTTEWLHHLEDNEIRSVALFDHETKMLGATEDGSLRIWDIKTAVNGRRTFKESGRSSKSLIFEDFSAFSGPSSSLKQPSVGTAVDSTLVHHSSAKAYIAVEDVLNEVDLNTMAVVSQQKWAWRITAISQQSSEDLPLMIGTSFTLNMHDPRMPLRCQVDNTGVDFDFEAQDRNTVFLPNYAKDWLANQPRPRLMRPNPPARPLAPPGSGQSLLQRVRRLRCRADPEIFASVEPGPQVIKHRGLNEIMVAGRMPSILFYDTRNFPQLQSVIHSGARLSSLSLLDYPPHGATSSTAETTLIAAGEYHGRGSLELYELPHSRASDQRASYDWPTEDANKDSRSASTSADQLDDSSPSTTPAADAPFSHKNRQSSSSAKLLSVATQGTRIVYSDSEGGIKWVERNGRGLARRWNINSFSYTHDGGAVVGEAVARKILTFAADEMHTTGKDAGMKRGDGDLLFWTGSEIGLVTSRLKRNGHDELVTAFEEMALDESGEGAERRKSLEEVRKQEDNYARTMRQALERQADERRFLARFGRTGGW